VKNRQTWRCERAKKVTTQGLPILMKCVNLPNQTESQLFEERCEAGSEPSLFLYIVWSRCVVALLLSLRRITYVFIFLFSLCLKRKPANATLSGARLCSQERRARSNFLAIRTLVHSIAHSRGIGCVWVLCVKAFTSLALSTFVRWSLPASSVWHCSSRADLLRTCFVRHNPCSSCFSRCPRVY